MQQAIHSRSSSRFNGYTSPTLRIYAEGGTLVAEFTNHLNTRNNERKRER